VKRFHIVVPVLNQARYVREALESLIAQASSVPLEVVVKDGGSSDGTLAEIARALSARHSASVRVLTEPDVGQADAIEKGMAAATADVVGWLNADDRLVSDALMRVAPVFDEPDVVAVYGDTRYIDWNGTPLFDLREQDFSRHDLLWGPCYIAQPSTFVASSAWREVGGLRSDLHYAMDLDLWLRLSRVGRIVHVREVLSEFRVHPRSKSVAAARLAHREARLVRTRHGAQELGRAPSRLEVETRHFAVRCKRKVRRLAGAWSR